MDGHTAEARVSFVAWLSKWLALALVLAPIMAPAAMRIARLRATRQWQTMAMNVLVNEYAIPAELKERSIAACDAAKDSPNHDHLVSTLQEIDGFHQLHLTAVRDHFSPQPGRIVDEEGKSVAADFSHWVKSQMAEHGGSARKVWETFKDRTWAVTRMKPAHLYLWVQNGPHPWDGMQLMVEAVREFEAKGPLFEDQYYPPERESDIRPSVPEPTRADKTISPTKYTLRSSLNMERFYRLGMELHAGSLARAAQVRVTVTPGDGTASYQSTMGEEHPEAFRQKWRVQRWFEDWAYSSAGRSGTIAGHHWAFDCSDWDSKQQVTGRLLDFVPLWAHTAKIAKIEPKMQGLPLYAKLLRLSERTGGVPFGWYFYGLHGNLVKDGSMLRVLDLVVQGEVQLPEHDYRVLKAWSEARYGF